MKNKLQNKLSRATPNRRWALASALFVAGATAAASPIGLLGGPDHFTGTFSSTRTTPGLFEEEFAFTGPSGLGWVNGSLTTNFDTRELTSQIVFTRVTMNGTVFEVEADEVFDSDVWRMQFLPNTLGAGPFVVRVSGCAGLCGAAGQDPQTITASYSGTLNVRRVNSPLPPSAVPEPGSLALALAALGAAALSARSSGQRPARPPRGMRNLGAALRLLISRRRGAAAKTAR